MSNKYYWCHQESESIGKVDSKAELHKVMELPLVEEIDEDEFKELKRNGWQD